LESTARFSIRFSRSSTNKFGGVALGTAAGSTGLSATAIGLFANAENDYSIAIGSNDGFGGSFNPTIASGNFAIAIAIAIGTESRAEGVRSVMVGPYAGGNPGVGNQRNSAFGSEAGRFVTGAGNTAAGLAAGHTVGGASNSALGNSAGQAVSGNNNTASGVVAGSTVTGSSNGAFGDHAGNNVTGDGNFAIGQISGSAVHGGYNVAFGYAAGQNVTGDNNVALGTNAGINVTATHTVSVGTNATARATGSVALGSGSLATVANTISVGSIGNQRRVMNVANALVGTDAVNLRQVKALIAAAKTGPIAGADLLVYESFGAATKNAVAPTLVIGTTPKSPSSKELAVSLAPAGGCTYGDIAGNWSMSGTNIAKSDSESVMWCDVQFSKSGNAKYHVAGNCRSHSTDETAAQTYTLSGN
jgi:autotransporter adhesin